MHVHMEMEGYMVVRELDGGESREILPSKRLFAHPTGYDDPGNIGTYDQLCPEGKLRRHKPRPRRPGAILALMISFA